MKPKNFEGMKLLRKIRVSMRLGTRSEFNSSELQLLQVHINKRLAKISRRVIQNDK